MYRSQTYEEFNEFADCLYDLCNCRIFGLFGRLHSKIDICDMIEDKCDGDWTINQDTYSIDEKINIDDDDNDYLFNRCNHINSRRCTERMEFVTPGNEEEMGMNSVTYVFVFLV